jgi:hypothetical protein
MGTRGMWGAPRPPSDPNLHTPLYRQTREYWLRRGKAEDIPCWRCGQRIAYSLPYFRIEPSGRKRVNHTAFCLGHLVGRDLAMSYGWTDAQINAITNCRPEHARCSGKSGYQYQASKRKALARSQRPASASASGRVGKYQDEYRGAPASITQAAAADRWR